MTSIPWERFQLGDEPVDVRDEIHMSWRRSQLSGVDPEHLELPYVEPHDESQFTATARHLIDVAAGPFVGSETCVLITDPTGHITARWVSDPSLRRDLDALEVAEGFFFDEEHAGTNGVGTSLESRRIQTVRGAEHYKKPFHAFTCSAAPVIHPLTRRAVGTVNITCREESTNALLEPAVLSLVRELERALLESAGSRPRRLFDAFLRARARAGAAPTITVSGEVLITDEAAARLAFDHQRLWQQVLEADGSEIVELAELGYRPARMTMVPHGTRPEGAVLTLLEPSAPSDPGSRTLRPHTSRERVRDTVRSLVTRGDMTVLRGETGVGKRVLAEEVLAAHDRPPGIVDAAHLPHAGPRGWSARIHDWLATDRALVLLHLEQLTRADADCLARSLTETGDTTVVATVTTDGSQPPGPLSGFLDVTRATVVEMPPLRLRTDELDGLIAALSGPKVRWSAQATRALHDHDWPANVAELGVVVRSAVTAAAGRQIGVEHLPPEVRPHAASRRLGLLEQSEANIIADVLAATGGNKSETARRLGLSRPTLYAKLKAYRI